MGGAGAKQGGVFTSGGDLHSVAGCKSQNQHFENSRPTKKYGITIAHRIERRVR